jgi:hypothetical protein
MNLDDLTLGQIKQLKNIFGVTETPEIEQGGDIRIVILQRGWVMVGRYYKKGSDCSLKNAYVIRNWGSTKGLGEIAENGPTDKTVLDSTPEVNFHELTVIASLKCKESKWDTKVK